MIIPLSEIKQAIREELTQRLNEFVSNEMSKGTVWRTGNKGWAAKNLHGVTEYFYGDDEVKNKAAAETFRKDNARKPVEHK